MLVQNLFRGSYAYETICQVRLSAAGAPPSGIPSEPRWQPPLLLHCNGAESPN